MKRITRLLREYKKLYSNRKIIPKASKPKDIKDYNAVRYGIRKYESKFPRSK